MLLSKDPKRVSKSFDDDDDDENEDEDDVEELERKIRYSKLYRKSFMFYGCLRLTDYYNIFFIVITLIFQ